MKTFCGDIPRRHPPANLMFLLCKAHQTTSLYLRHLNIIANIKLSQICSRKVTQMYAILLFGPTPAFLHVISTLMKLRVKTTGMTSKSYYCYCSAIESNEP